MTWSRLEYNHCTVWPICQAFPMTPNVPLFLIEVDITVTVYDYNCMSISSLRATHMMMYRILLITMITLPS